MSAENSLSKDLAKDQDGFRWSFDEIKNIFVKARSSGERGSSTGSFHWSFSGTIDAIRARFSSHERSLTEKSIVNQDGAEPSKKLRMEEEDIDKDAHVDKGTRRENRREARKGKSEKEKDRRNNVNGLFYQLGGLLGMEPGVKNKSQILSNAKDFLDKGGKSDDASGRDASE